MALGAARSDVVSRRVGHGLKPLSLGVAAGLAAAGAHAALSTMLFGVRPFDVPTYAALSLVLAAFALAACYLPRAPRRARRDPTAALRCE